MGEAWSALSTLLAGIAVWGAVGFGLDRLLRTAPFLLIVGVFAGNFLGVYLIYAKYFPRETPGTKAQPPGVAGWPKASPIRVGEAQPHPRAPEISDWPRVSHAGDDGSHRDAS